MRRVKQHINEHHHIHHCIGYGGHVFAGGFAAFHLDYIAGGLALAFSIYLFILALAGAE